MGFQETIGIQILKAEKESVILKLDITKKVLQPFGYLHGGVSLALAEHAASIGAMQTIEKDEIAFGQEINASHLRPKKFGTIIATAKAIHRGKTTQIWQVEITDEENQLVCMSRCSIAVRRRKASN